MKPIMPLETVIFCQCSRTGSFLLEEVDGLWRPSALAVMEGFSPMRQLLDEMEPVITEFSTLTYIISDRDTLHLYHAWTERERMPHKGGKFEWFDMFNFPEDLHESIDWIFDSSHFLETILDPA